METLSPSRSDQLQTIQQALASETPCLTLLALEEGDYTFEEDLAALFEICHQAQNSSLLPQILSMMREQVKLMSTVEKSQEVVAGIQRLLTSKSE